MAICPTRDDLERLLAETLSAELEESTVLHVERCAACQGTLGMIASGESDPAYLRTLMASSQPGSRDAPDELDDFVRRLKQSIDLTGFELAGQRSLPQAPAIAGYDVLEVLGRGAVGVVHRARHRELDRCVALKLISAATFPTPKVRQRVQVEARAMARLEHEHIVRVYDVGECEGSLYIAMELVEGDDLATHLSTGPRPAREAASFVARMARAVAHAHGKGVIHRDLKPANVLLAASAREAGDRAGPISLSSCEFKLTDFGLAKFVLDARPNEIDSRQAEAGARAAPASRRDGMTLSGEFLGTPSYTAPEQARGDAKAAGPEADVYSLGAILYEMLTARPPFQGASLIETLLQVAHHEPVPAARLVPDVPTELDTICLKCLEKEPARRFASADELADDLERFLRQEPIHARPASRVVRTRRWLRRHPARAVAFASGALAACALVGFGTSLALRRAETDRAVRDELALFARSARASDWLEARTAWERAQTRLGDGGSAELRALVDRSARELELVTRLERIRLERTAPTHESGFTLFEPAQASERYEAALGEVGFGSLDEPPAAAAARISQSNARDALLAAIDDWVLLALDSGAPERRDWLVAVARAADPDPTGWRDRVRDLSVTEAADLRALADAAPLEGSSAPLLVSLAERLRASGADPVAYLGRVQRAHPDDFWVNLALANALRVPDPIESLAYYRAALALRPDAAAVHCNTASALRLLGRWDEALECSERAVLLEPGSTITRGNLGWTLERMERWEAAAEQYESVLELDPSFAAARVGLTRIRLARGLSDEALSEARATVQLLPDSAMAHHCLGSVLRARKELGAAFDSFQVAVQLAPRNSVARYGFGLACLERGRIEEAVAECAKAVELDPREALAHLNLGLALHTQGRFDEAIAHSRRALELDPTQANAFNNLGLSLDAQGKVDEALAAYRKASELEPSSAIFHNSVGAVLAQSGRAEEALLEFERAAALDASYLVARGNLAKVRMQLGDFAGARPLLQECLDGLSVDDPTRTEMLGATQYCDEALELERRLPEALQAPAGSLTGPECVQFAEHCHATKRFACSTRLFERAIALEPAQAEDLRSSLRFHAACAAALAGCGRGVDATEADENERAHWRNRSREWLRADLAAWDTWVTSGNPKRAAFAGSRVGGWLADADLAGVREEGELRALPIVERQEWRSLWDDVAALIERAAAEGAR